MLHYSRKGLLKLKITRVYVGAQVKEKYALECILLDLEKNLSVVIKSSVKGCVSVFVVKGTLLIGVRSPVVHSAARSRPSRLLLSVWWGVDRLTPDLWLSTLTPLSRAPSIHMQTPISPLFAFSSAPPSVSY